MKNEFRETYPYDPAYSLDIGITKRELFAAMAMQGFISFALDAK